VTRLITLLVLLLVVVGLSTVPASASAPPQHSVAVTGAGVAAYPAFSPSVSRYAVTTTDETGGTLTVRASTTDGDGRVLVNGRRLEGDRRKVSGLAAGDEVSVVIQDGDGTASYSFIYLPSGFPKLERVVPDVAGGPSAGHVMLTLGLWTEPSPFFETAVDVNGVPVYVRATPNSMDLKRQPNGNYSVARSTGGSTGADIVELDTQFREVARHRTVGLVNTDTHDSILLPDGTAYLLAYEPNRTTGKTDAIVQHVGADGSVLFEWNSKDYVDIPAETVVGQDRDYAHVNSIDLMGDGHLLVSFRHFSSVFKIARHAHDGHVPGEVIWKLGGRASDFVFVDAQGQPSDGGPCAQHTATELPNGQIMVFDNGAWHINPLCPNPDAIAGEPVPRLPSRVAVWDLDEHSGIATLVSDHRVENRYAIFAGSAQPLVNGNTVVGWASARDAVVSELDNQGRVVWELQDAEAPKYFTYRAFKADVPDAIAPKVRMKRPAQDATYELGQRVRPAYSCTDRGGSNLQTCTAGTIDTSTVGTHTAAVTAVDGAGNRTSVERSYTVARPARQPDAMIRLAHRRRYVGTNDFGARPRQIVESSIERRRGRSTAVVQVRNAGTRPDRYRVWGRASSSALAVRLIFPDGVRTSPRLAPGEIWRFRVRVTRKARTGDGQRVTEKVVVRSRREGDRSDVVWFRVRAR
jgi:hypothetical protein